MNDNNKTRLSVISLFIVGLAWGTSYAIVKDSINDIKPFMLMSLRFGVSTILLMAIFFKKLKTITKKDLYNGSVIGIFMFLSFLTLIIGILYTTASKQSFLVGTYIVIIPFLSWLINKIKPDIYSISGTALAVLGIALLTLDSSFTINKGDFISIICSFFFACHIISIEHFNKDMDPIVSTLIQFSITSILFIILTGVFESFTFDFTSKNVNSILYLSVVTTVLPFVVQNIAQKYISSTSTAIILTLESAFGGVFAVFFLNEAMTLKMILGCIVIFLGVFIDQSKLSFMKKYFVKNNMKEKKDINATTSN